jgi:predicted dehydrogenase
MEAFHYRYHPMADRITQLLHAERRLGALTRVETWMCFPLPKFDDIRYRYDLAGGALMDAGCYAVHAARFLTGAEPEVTAARATLRDPKVDRAMSVALRFPGGVTGTAHTSLWSRELLHIGLTAYGERGRLSVPLFIAPQVGWLKLTADGRTTRERIGGDSTYVYQLRAFAAATRGEDTNRTPPPDSIRTMRVIDAAYRAAGLPPRGTP